MPLYNVLLFNTLQNTNNFFEFPYQSGFLDFVLGGLTLLSVYHLFLFFQNRNKLYLLYSLYLTFIILSQIRFAQTGFITSILDHMGIFKEYGEIYTETYHIIYFFFAFKFLEIKEDFPKWYRYLINALYIIGGFCALKFLYYALGGSYSYVEQGYFVFVIYILILSIFLYILFFKSIRPLKYYLITGSLILLFFSVLSLLKYLQYRTEGESIEPSYIYLYFGFILENIIFSLGLGKKQKLILNERNQAQENLINQLEENKKLEIEVRKKLEQDVELLQAKVERDKLERLTIQYERDLVELKLASLRSQMNPHFIFNSLNSIKGFIIDNEQENAVFYLNKFSKLIRMILSSSMEKNISLAQEIEIAKLYVNVENIRFNNEILFTLNIDKELSLNTIKVPALLFQPFLENAIWHGLAAKEGRKELLFSAVKKDGVLKVTIKDNGVGRTKSSEYKKKKLMKRESFGMKLTEDRLENFVASNKGKYHLTIKDLYDKRGQAVGTLVKVKLPIVLN
ncbi:hypothetical protein C5O00_10225 [Pukyongia salina]|uniref:7TM diverse intracellular signalling n=1 Tax=Pukyongia salina TaxID=2094025 RepID=A0A2S0HXZ4_9FLAO|nr:histidine kinase [Pukyongia salina]AVI51522.1 hypothetical protein C5O00_10225 [Pukyongia salina]